MICPDCGGKDKKCFRCDGCGEICDHCGESMQVCNGQCKGRETNEH